MKDDEVEDEKVFVCLSTVAKEEREKDGEFSDMMQPTTSFLCTLLILLPLMMEKSVSQPQLRADNYRRELDGENINEVLQLRDIQP